MLSITVSVRAGFKGSASHTKVTLTTSSPGGRCTMIVPEKFHVTSGSKFVCFLRFTKMSLISTTVRERDRRWASRNRRTDMQQRAT